MKTRVLIYLILIDAVVGVGIYFLSALFTDQRGIQICAGLIGGTFAAVVSVKWLISKAEERISIDNLTRRLLDLGLTEHVLNKGRFLDLIKSALIYHQNLPAIDANVGKLIDRSVAQTASIMEHACEGEISVAVEDIRQHGMTIVDDASAGDLLFSTSYISSEVWWKGKQGGDYLKHKIDAAREGVSVKQVFISPDRQDLMEDEGLFNLLSTAKLGPKGVPIKLYAITEDNVTTASCRDVLLVKGKAAFVLNLQGRFWISGYTIYTAPSAELDALGRYFDSLLSKPNLVAYDHTKDASFHDFVAKVFG